MFSQFLFHIKKFFNIGITIVSAYRFNQIFGREIINPILFPRHNGVKILSLLFNSFLHHSINRITSVNLYFLYIIKESTYRKIGRAGKSSYTVAISELTRFCMCNSLLSFRFDDSDINTFLRYHIGQTTEKLLLVFIERCLEILEI